MSPVTVILSGPNIAPPKLIQARNISVGSGIRVYANRKVRSSAANDIDGQQDR